MQDLNNTLEKIKKFLDRCRKEANLSLDDAVAAQWEKVDFVSLEYLLVDLGIKANPDVECKQYSKKAEKIIKKLDIREIELGNVEADIRLSSVNYEKAKMEAQELAVKCRSLESLLAEMLGHREKLHNSASIIKDNLGPHTLIGLAEKRIEPKSRESFKIGYKHYLIVSGEKGEAGNNATLKEYFQAVSVLQKRISKIELPELPPIIKYIIQQQIDICYEAGSMIKIFLDFCGESFREELEKINNFKKKLEELSRKNIPDIIDNTEEQADVLAQIIRNFFYKSYLIKELVKVEMLLDNLRHFLHLFKGDCLKNLNGELSASDSALNPDALADQFSVEYFSGLKGVIRMLKLLYGSLKGQKTISEIELQEKLSTIIRTCFFYSCDEQDAAEKISNFINGHLEGYQQPFPHDELAERAKKAIKAYSEAVEKYIYHIMINPLPTENGVDDDQSKPRPISLGRLIGKIEARTAVLAKIQHEQEQT